MIVALGADHHGVEHKDAIKKDLAALDHEAVDLGCDGSVAADYPEYALAVAELVGRGEARFGVLICGSGIGMSIAANKVRGVRASLCFNEEQARLTREHNDSNVLCLSGQAITPEQALAICRAYLAGDFAGGRHLPRVDKIVAYENDHLK